MYISIDCAAEFRQLFVDAGRDSNFSYHGLGYLYDELDRRGYQEIDVIELCCTFTENAPRDIIREYDIDHNDDDNETDIAMDWLEDMTYAELLPNGNILFQEF